MACRIVADDDDRQPRLDPGGLAETPRGGLDLLDHFGRSRFSVNDCRHVASPSLRNPDHAPEWNQPGRKRSPGCVFLLSERESPAFPEAQ